VIVNEHIKLKTVNWDTAWGGVFSGEGTRPGAQNRQNLPLLDAPIGALALLGGPALPGVLVILTLIILVKSTI